jgi:glycosyltransferase involved in cell wall biosynthesis
VQHRSAVTVILPAYNEEKTIGDVISDITSIMEVLNVPYEIIVIDDGSTDKTGLIASNYKATVLSNETTRGKGYSLRRALQYAQGDIIVTIDSDGEHKPKEIPDLIEPLFNGTDIVAGSRFLGNQRRPTTKLNQIGNFLFNATIMTLTGKVVTDSQTGFRAIKKHVLETLNLESDGYEIETEITVKSLRNGFVFKEKPITVERRKYNMSKLKLLFDGTRILKTILKANFSKIQHKPNE